MVFCLTWRRQKARHRYFVSAASAAVSTIVLVCDYCRSRLWWTTCCNSMMFGIQLNDHYGNQTPFQLSTTKSLRTVNHTFYIISSMEKTKCWFASHLKFITIFFNRRLTVVRCKLIFFVPFFFCPTPLTFLPIFATGTINW